MSEPVSPTFSLAIQPTAADIDELDHVSNLVYVRWLQDVAIAHSEAIGWDFARYQALGASFVVRRHEIDYLRPAMLGDDIVLKTWLGSLKAASSMRMTSIVKRVSEPGGDARELELARSSTLWAFMGLKTGRPQRIPDDLREAFMRPLPT